MEEAEEQLLRLLPRARAYVMRPHCHVPRPGAPGLAHRQGIGWHDLTPALEAEGAAPVALVGKQTNKYEEDHMESGH